MSLTTKNRISTKTLSNATLLAGFGRIDQLTADNALRASGTRGVVTLEANKAWFIDLTTRKPGQPLILGRGRESLLDALRVIAHGYHA